LCFLGKRFCVSRAPAAGIFRDFFSRDLIGLHNSTCVGLSLHMPTQFGFISGILPLAAQRVEHAGTKQRGGPPLGRTMVWPWPLACEERSGALGGIFLDPEIDQSIAVHDALNRSNSFFIGAHGQELLGERKETLTRMPRKMGCHKGWLATYGQYSRIFLKSYDESETTFGNVIRGSTFYFRSQIFDQRRYKY